MELDGEKGGQARRHGPYQAGSVIIVRNRPTSLDA